MKADASTTVGVVIAVAVAVLILLLALYWLGLIQNPFDIAKKNELKSRFCLEVQERTQCHLLTVSSIGDLDIDKDTESLRIKKKEVGASGSGQGGGDSPATYGEICEYLGYRNRFAECLVKLCSCKITSVK